MVYQIVIRVPFLDARRDYCTVNGILPIRKKKRHLENNDEATTLTKIIEEGNGHQSFAPVVIDLDEDSADLVSYYYK